MTVGPFAIIDGAARIAAGCRIGAQAQVVGRTTLGKDNQVFSGAILGMPPQHRAYEGEDSELIVGDGNIFREYFTAHKGWSDGEPTRIGSRNFFMCGSHVGHNAVVGDDCVFTNTAAVGGHAVIEDCVNFGGGAAVHQFSRVGRLAMLGGQAGMGVDLPPFTLAMGTNAVVALNLRGMQRAGFPPETIAAVKKAFRIYYMRRLPRDEAFARIEAQLGNVPEVREMVDFIRTSKRGVAAYRKWQHG